MFRDALQMPDERRYGFGAKRIFNNQVRALHKDNRWNGVASFDSFLQLSQGRVAITMQYFFGDLVWVALHALNGPQRSVFTSVTHHYKEWQPASLMIEHIFTVALCQE